ncbi:cardiolipin synthase ClsB [Azotobacter chroococcum]|uniref:Cardiolipin synthase B n=1 Tax=Azotobacter chroococcum TaxID=353 RepID=A0AAP9YD64_9GAMM|nr:cardiolipin synthase ClsB [Azotobacter chroococcum]QQE86974.1 cardiolipin synthase ClsB [Azotobacter chroococcum]
MSHPWRSGNRLWLLENGEEFFPRVFEAIRQARQEILIETFILFEDKVGNELHRELIAAAQRGVRIEITVDGFGSADLTAEFVAAMTEVGIRIRMFDPRPRRFGMRINLFRRLHRKIVVIDGARAFIGGINFSADHLGDFGPTAKQDYSVEVIGPVTRDIHRFALASIAASEPSRLWWRRRRARNGVDEQQTMAAEGTAQVLFVTRDNRRHTNDIEEQYLEAIRQARHRLVIANAYFFPGYRLLREIRRAARRGVRVELILQGQPDMPIAKFGARLFYEYLLKDGVDIHEYCERPLHGKVALADDEWATVGSSNLDPLSLSLNLEANLIIRDRAFNQELSERLERLRLNHCRLMTKEKIARGTWWRMPLAFLAYHALSHFPAWVGWLPAHSPKVELLQGYPPPNGGNDLRRPSS